MAAARPNGLKISFVRKSIFGCTIFRFYPYFHFYIHLWNLNFRKKSWRQMFSFSNADFHKSTYTSFDQENYPQVEIIFAPGLDSRWSQKKKHSRTLRLTPFHIIFKNKSQRNGKVRKIFRLRKPIFGKKFPTALELRINSNRFLIRRRHHTVRSLRMF